MLPTTAASAALVWGCLCTGHRTHDKLVIQRMPVSSSLQYSSGPQVQPLFIVHESRQIERVLLARQAPPACVAELCLSTVVVPERKFNRDSAAAADEKKATAVLVGIDLSAAFDTINHDVLTSLSAVSKASLALTAVLPAGCACTSQTGSSS